MKKIYVLDPKMKWKTFKLLQEKFVKDSGPVLVGGDKIIWNMMRKREVLCWFDPEIEGDMMMGLKIPTDKHIVILSGGKK